MSLHSHLKALIAERRVRLTRWVLAHRIRARHPSLICDPTAVWDYAYSGLAEIEIGQDVSVAAFAEILIYRQSPFSSIPGKLVLGDRSVIATGANIRAAGGTIRVGANSVISQHTVAVAANHAIKAQTPYLRAPWDEGRTGVDVGENVWVGANCVLLPGTRIGNNTVIAAGSVVRGEVPSDEVWGGVPARFLKKV